MQVAVMSYGGLGPEPARSARELHVARIKPEHRTDVRNCDDCTQNSAGQDVDRDMLTEGECGVQDPQAP